MAPSLPVVGTGQLSKVRKSSRSKWRAGVLIAVHGLIAAHITHFLIAGRTVSPVEPSESMYTLELGYVNAGILFFGVVLGATLVFGRFFCGWACHIVALQDLCAWLMKKLGVRPRPFRSRLMAFVPLVVALYMFVWPSLLRLLPGSDAPAFPGFTNHLVTSRFWETFPGPTFAVLTFLVCGFAAVYFLGAKGFCTYGCPYGALFGAADVLSPGRILVTDACEQCGHCTATCTSNVRVHEEVKLYGMVVDPGCMKCMDCVNVCPKNALHFGFAKPSLLKRAPAVPRARRYDLGLGEELFVGAVCVVATLAYRGLYDGPPLLMSVGLAGVIAFLSLETWRLTRRPDVRIQNVALKVSGKLSRAGVILAGVTTLVMAFTAHSAFVQWHRAWGRHHLARTEATREEVLAGTIPGRSYREEHHRAAEKAFRHFSLADRWGLAGFAEVKLGLAWCSLLRGDTQAAEAKVREAIALDPAQSGRHQDLVDLLLARGHVEDAIEAMKEKIERVDPNAGDHFQLAGLLVSTGRLEGAAQEYAASLQLSPEVAEARYNYGGVLRRLGLHLQAIEQLEAAARLAPGDAPTQVELGLAYLAAGRSEEALSCLQRAVEIDPDSPESQFHLQELIRDVSRTRDSGTASRGETPERGR